MKECVLHVGPFLSILHVRKKKHERAIMTTITRNGKSKRKEVHI